MPSPTPPAVGRAPGAAPMRRRLLLKIVGGVALAILVIEVILLVPSLLAQNERLRGARMMTARVLAHALLQPVGEALVAGDAARAVRVVTAAATDPYVHMVLLVDQERTTIACSVPEHIGLPHRTPAVEAVLAPGGPDEAGHDAGRLYEYVRPVRGPDGAAVGAVVVSVDLSAIPGELVAFTLRTLGVVLIILLFTGCVIGFYLYAVVLKPVWRIVRANVAAAGGDREQAYVKPEEIPDDEIGDIARTRNEMLAVIEAHSQDLEAMVVRGIADPIALLDADRRVLLRNRPGDLLAGGRDGGGEAAPGGCQCEVHRLRPETPEGGCPAAQSLETGQAAWVAFTVDGPDERRFFEASAFPLVDARPIKVIEQVRDVSERVRLETIARRNERLAVVGEMAAGMAHEIRNPLASIVTSVDLLAAEPGRPIDEEGQTLLGILKKESRRINRLLTDFLKFARPRPLRVARTDLNAVVRGVAELARTHPKNGGRVVVGERLESGLPLVDADVDLLEQALLNIAINALEAMPEGGDLTFVTSAGDALEIAVADTGIGISEAERTRIFEPFHTTKADGTGLGLAITYRIVESHGGTITVDGRPGGGTIVRVRLPGAAAAARRARGVGAGAARHAEGR